MEKRIEKNGQLFEVKVVYDLGGTSWATGQPKARGYYLSVQPITIEDRGNGITVKKFVAFSGVRMLLNEVTRKSNKQYEIACDMVDDELIDRLIERCKY